MNRKYKLKNKYRFIMCISILTIIITTMFFSIVVYARNNTQKEYFSYTIKSGDTLWSIACQNANNTDVRKYIYKIREINNLESAIIHIGQELLLP